MKRLFVLFSFVCLLLLSSCEKEKIIYYDQAFTDVSFGKRGGTKTLVNTNDRYYFARVISIKNMDTKEVFLSRRSDADKKITFVEGDGITATLVEGEKITITVAPSTEHHYWHVDISSGNCFPSIFVTQN